VTDKGLDLCPVYPVCQYLEPFKNQREMSSLRDVQYCGVAGGSSDAVSYGVQSAGRPRFSWQTNEHQCLGLGNYVDGMMTT